MLEDVNVSQSFSRDGKKKLGEDDDEDDDDYEGDNKDNNNKKGIIDNNNDVGKINMVNNTIVYSCFSSFGQEKTHPSKGSILSNMRDF